ncbi:oligopeptidase A [Pseudomonas silesiensis]|uniref:Oligopeptidase A n=1 Tax=Pseudomonas silesiensis TaxID=1853130 RepID=A0A191YLJ6_9PSED|nr:M3 family metallopeptidase [Pseudomonas silesiensis]ANJ53638.1 oligopeptidase A [Pseudomonas silesiensis]
MPSTNPLLQQWSLPPWSTVRLEHLLPAIEKIVADNRLTLCAIIASQSAHPNWDDLVLAVDETDARLDEAMGVIRILGTVKRHGDAWLEAVATCEDISAQYTTEKMSNVALFRGYQALAQSPASELFDPSRKTVLNKILRKFRRSGIKLADAQQQELALLDSDMEALEGVFLTQLQLANLSWSKRIDDVKQLNGLSPDIQDRMALSAQQAGHDGWRLQLDEATYNQVMTYAEDRALREAYFFAYTTRASDQGPNANQFDNAPLLQQLLAKRHQKARLLGYENYAQFILMDRMAESTDQVKQFLLRQIALATPAFEQETRSIKDFAITQGILQVQPWDHEFLVAKLREHKYGSTLKNLRNFFPLEGTLRKVCSFSERMFSIRINEQEVFERWHDSVRLFEIGEQGRVIGYIYVDPYRRTETSDFAGTSTLRNRRRNAEGRVPLPIAVLHGNFPQGTADQPCLLDHKDLRVLLHEFGHCLQHVLTRSPHHTLSGISELGRDSAEFAGQVFELWCSSREFLLWLSGHHQTGHRLTEAQVDTALTSINAYGSWPTGQLLMSALFDFELHLAQSDGRTVQQVFDAVQREVPHLNIPAWCRFANSFDYLVTGYEASVYAYKWSGVLASEAFKRFQQEWVFDASTGKEFRETVLAPGGSQSLLQSIEAFLKQPLPLDFFPATVNRHQTAVR